MKNIFIIGAGNIGSRHLQSLNKIGRSISINVIDPSSKSLIAAKEFFNFSPKNNHVRSINFHKNIEKTNNQNIDFPIRVSIAICNTST